MSDSIKCKHIWVLQLPLNRYGICKNCGERKLMEPEDRTLCCGCGEILPDNYIKQGIRWCDLCQIEIKDCNKQTLRIDGREE